MKTKLKAVVLAIALFGAASFSAEARPARGWMGQRSPVERPSRLSSRIRENIITLKLLRMTQALDLTPEQTAVIYPVLTRIEKEKYDLTRKLSGVVGDLRGLVKENIPDDKKLVELMGEIDRLRAEIAGKDQETAAFLSSKLSVVQRAKYVLFSAEFYRGLGERLERFRAQHYKNPFTP